MARTKQPSYAQIKRDMYFTCAIVLSQGGDFLFEAPSGGYYSEDVPAEQRIMELRDRALREIVTSLHKRAAKYDDDVEYPPASEDGVQARAAKKVQDMLKGKVISDPRT